MKNLDYTHSRKNGSLTSSAVVGVTQDERNSHSDHKSWQSEKWCDHKPEQCEPSRDDKSSRS